MQKTPRPIGRRRDRRIGRIRYEGASERTRPVARLSGDLACQTESREFVEVPAGCRGQVPRAAPTRRQCARRQEPAAEQPDARRNPQLKPASDRNQPGDDNWSRGLRSRSWERIAPGSAGSALARRQNRGRRWWLEFAAQNHSGLTQYTAPGRQPTFPISGHRPDEVNTRVVGASPVLPGTTSVHAKTSSLPDRAIRG